MSEKMRLICPACGIEQGTGSGIAIHATYNTNDTGGHDTLTCKCNICGFTWNQRPLYAIEEDER